MKYPVSFPINIVAGLFLLVACQSALVPDKYFTHQIDKNDFEMGCTNNSYFPEYRPELPLDLLEEFRPSSAPQQKLCLLGNILYVPTKDGKVEAYDLIELDQIGDYKLPSGIQANVVPVKMDLLVSLEYGEKSLMLIDPSKNKTIWTAKLGSIKANPKVIHGKVVAATLYRGLVCLDAQSGEIIWELDLKSQLHASPAIADSIVFQVTENGRLYAIDLENGDERWHRDLNGTVISSPVFLEGTLICCTRDGRVLAFTPNSEKQWQYRCEGLIRRIPSATHTTVVVADQNGIVYALERSSGKMIWRRSFDTIIGTSPVLTDEYVIFGTLNDLLVFLKLDSGEPKWELELYGNVRTDPLVWQNNLIVGSKKNYIYILTNPSEQ